MVAPHHGHYLRGARFLGGGAAPSLLKRTDQDFVAALLKELESEAGRQQARATTAADRDPRRVLRLFQPVHRVFHLVVLELACDEPGVAARANPKRIEGSGLVVRRLARRYDPAGNPLPYDLARPPALQEVEGWMRDGDRVRGWMRLDGRRAHDPDPSKRRPPLRAGNPAVTALLRQPDLEWDRWAETVSPLFVAPPEVCEAAGATLLYGVVPVTSGELAEQLPEPPKTDDRGLDAMTPAFLGAGTWTFPAEVKPTRLPEDAAKQEWFLARIRDLSLLRGLDAFDGTAEGNELLKVLDGVEVRAVDSGHVVGPLGQTLKAAARAFEDEEAKGPGRELRWTVPAGGDFAGKLREALRALVNRKLDSLTAGVGRFDRRGALYQVQAFARVRRCKECPPDLVWSAPGEPFAIVPWYEGSGAAPVQVPLPEAKLSELAKLKPNVAFQVPASVQDLLGGMKVKTPMEIESGNLKLGLDWICGFSIPLITLCAFIVLSIFLMLLNIIFWWLPFIKICIPIPTVSRSERT
jgi:hypothetical protein